MGDQQKVAQPGTLLPRNIKGAKWFNGASYLTDEDRKAVVAKVVEAMEHFGRRGIGVRPASYTGEPHPIAVVTFAGGSQVYGYVYKQQEN